MSIQDTLHLIDKRDVERLLPFDEVMVAVEEAFRVHSDRSGRVFAVVREALPSGAVFGIKSGDVATQALLGFKAAGFWPGNRSLGREAHQATILLFDPDTGRPLCMMDGNAVTTARTAAAGAIGLRTLARKDCRSITVFGSGVQARAQLAAALRLLPTLEKVWYLTHDRVPDASFERAFSASPCSVVHTADADAAVAGSDVVVTATTGGGPLFDADAVRPGTHVNAVGTDTRGKQELPSALLSRAKVFADDRLQSRQMGELQWHDVVEPVEIGDVLSGRHVHERSPEDVTVFDMTGLALQDLTVARMIQRSATLRDLGVRLAWLW